jgi:hypothetical protein
MRLSLFGTSGCHLCDIAESLIVEALEARDAPISLCRCDILEQASWLIAYQTRIPVLVLGEEELAWPFDRNTLQHFLDLHLAKAHPRSNEAASP